MNDSTRGLVRTPPKSETTTSIPAAFSLIGGAHDLVVAEALASRERPAKEGDVRIEPGSVYGAGADQAAGAAQRLHLLADPELQGRPPLNPVRAVLGREERLGDLDRGGVRVTEDRDDLLSPVVGGARRPHRAQRQQAAVREDDADRAAQGRVLAHGPRLYLPR